MSEWSREEAELFLRARLMTGQELLNYEPVFIPVELPIDLVVAIGNGPFTDNLTYDACRTIYMACRKTLLISEGGAA